MHSEIYSTISRYLMEVGNRKEISETMIVLGKMRCCCNPHGALKRDPPIHFVFASGTKPVRSIKPFLV